MNTLIETDGKIETFTGKFVNPLDLKVEDICIEDIAHSLSLQCRFSGHCRQHYSVAQHSVLVASICPKQHQLWGLLHDASEAYLVDLPRPIKKAEPMQHYRNSEADVMRTICRKYGLPPEIPECVKVADNVILATEARDLMSSSKSWGTLQGITPLPDPIVPWLPQQTEMVFLQIFKMLKQWDT